jgi:hypothetical protein
MQGPNPHDFYLGKIHGSRSSIEDQGHLRQCQEGDVRLQGRFYPEWHSAPRLSVDCREVCKKEPTYPSHRLCSRPCRKVRGRPTDELGEVPGESVGTRLQRSIRSRLRIPF